MKEANQTLLGLIAFHRLLRDIVYIIVETWRAASLRQIYA
jgi:hypothetical protein